MTKGFLDRLAEMDRSSYVDMSRDMLPPERRSRRERNCIEDRTNAHVMRENGMTPDEILARFGYIPDALPDQKPAGPFRLLRPQEVETADTVERTLAVRHRRGSMEPG